MIDDNTRAARPPRPAPPSNWLLLHHGVVGFLLGFPLSVALSGLLVYHATGVNPDPTKSQVTMWSVFPIWLAVICLSFMARDSKACWAWLLGANLGAGVLLYFLAGPGATRP